MGASTTFARAAAKASSLAPRRSASRICSCMENGGNGAGIASGTGDCSRSLRGDPALGVAVEARIFEEAAVAAPARDLQPRAVGQAQRAELGDRDHRVVLA